MGQGEGSHDGVLGRRDWTAAFPPSAKSGLEANTPAKKPRPGPNLVSIGTDALDEDEIIVEGVSGGMYIHFC